ncbi:MAG TPA: 2-phosphosulfolactate phosphatase [Verrucomicrobiales bacterium]|nr:2-phosphosulfolactate phosphatase [Verrucomicrobiales bacterium]
MADTTLEVLLTPAEYERPRAWENHVCVVFDILRATTSMVSALASGAAGILPVAGIEEAVQLKQAHPGVLLAGEREGLRITADLSGGVEFDLGNSPREFLPEKVAGRTIVLTTTNGTRALRACARAETVLVGSFHNLRAVTHWLRKHRPPNLLLICSGTHEEAALEDTLAAGALCERIWPDYSTGQVADSAEMARRLYPLMQTDLVGAMHFSRNGRRLLSHPELRADVPYCMQRELHQLQAVMQPNGLVTALPDERLP